LADKEKVGMRRALLCVFVAVFSLGIAACGGSSSSSAQSRTVQVDGKTDKFNGDFLAYFPDQVTVHAGDTVDFKENWTGEPHTVTFGTLAEKDVQAYQANPNAQQSLPSLIPGEDFGQNAAQPCYLANGSPPGDPNTACAKNQQTQSDFAGTESFYNSGFLPEGANFKVKLSSSIKPGRYSYYCLLHGPMMSGSITVVGSDKSVPSSDTVDKQATTQQAALVNKVLPTYNAARAGQFPVPGVKNVAGYGDPSAPTVGINEFIPATIQAKVGQPVSWAMIGAHTLSFGKAPIEPGKFYSKAPDGAWHINQAFAPTGFPPAPQPGNTPPNAPISMTPLNGGSYDGTTFKSTGVVQSFPPALVAPEVTFTKPGSYTYVCLIHPGMGGVVTVS
jgi:plastocyanin